VILPSKTVCINKENYDIESLGDEHVIKVKQFSFFGMYGIGTWPIYSIYYRKQQWMEWESTETGREIRFRDELTPYLIVKPFEYAMFLEEAEDKNGVPLNVEFTVILVPTNATRPIFDIDDAYGQIQTLCLGEALLYVKEKTFSNLGESELDKLIQDEFSNQICKINDQIPGRPEGDGIVKCYGYKAVDAKLNTISVAGPLKAQLLEASTAEYIATEKKKAKIATAEGDSEAMKLEATGIEAKLKVQSDYLKNISIIPGAMNVEKRRATPGLTTLVEGEEKTSLIIGGK